MKRNPVRIDSIPADGVELADEKLAAMVGGLRKPGAGSSKTLNNIRLDGSSTADNDTDF